MAKDTTIGIRLEKSTLENLKNQAAKNKTTPSSLVAQVIDEITTGQALIKDQKIQVLELKNKELEARLDKEYSKTIPRKKRISIAVSDAEYFEIQKSSNAALIPKSTLLRKILFGKKENQEEEPKQLSS